jgi:hypothetical protein
MTTVRLAQSGEIIHRAARVWGLIGVSLREQMWPLRLNSFWLDSVLEIWTIEAVISLEKRRVRKYAEEGCEVFFCSRLFFCVFVPADFVFVGY